MGLFVNPPGTSTSQRLQGLFLAGAAAAMSDVVGMKHYQEVYDSLCQVLHDIDVLRKYNRQFPILRVVSSAVHSSCLRR